MLYNAESIINLNQNILIITKSNNPFLIKIIYTRRIHKESKKLHIIIEVRFA